MLSQKTTSKIKSQLKRNYYNKQITGYAAVSVDTATDILVPFIYSDSFFFSLSCNYSIQLARVSMVSAYSAFNTGDFTNGSKNLQNFFESCGFYDFESNDDYHQIPGTDTFGVGIAHKEIKISGKPYTIISIGLRGGNYTNEWAGNFHVGESGDHAGFTICADKAFTFLNQYIQKNNIKGNVKIWSCGFSRGAAGNNMFGAHLDEIIFNQHSNQYSKAKDKINKQPDNDLFSNINITLDDVFIYCFETPQGTISNSNKSPIYNNIHNTLNYHDMVTRMGPTAMGFKRFGIDHYLPCKDYYDKKEYEKLYNKVTATYKKMDNGRMYKNLTRLNDKFGYINFDPRTPRENCTDFIDRVMGTLSDIAGYREGMYNIQEDLKNFIIMVKASQTNPDGNRFFFEFLSFIKSDADDIMAFMFSNKDSKEITNSKENSIGKENSKKNQKFEERLEKHAEKALKDSGVVIYDHKRVHDFISAFTDFQLEFANKYPSDAVNVIANLLNTIIPHDPTLEVAWLNTIPVPMHEPKYF